MNRDRVAVCGAVLAGLGAGLCCMSPIVAAIFGAGAAGLASASEPARPYLLWLMVLGLSVAGYRYFRRLGCTRPDVRAREGIILVSAAVLALVFATYPTWSKMLGLR